MKFSIYNNQFARENDNKAEKKLNGVKVKSEEELSEEAVQTTLRRALTFYSTLQADDGFWPGDFGGPLFLLPGLVTFFIFYFFIFYNLIFQSIYMLIYKIRICIYAWFYNTLH